MARFPFIKKQSVRVKGLYCIFYKQFFIDSVVDAFRKYSNSADYQPVVTSAVDGKHSKWSEHYAGFALDFRIWGFSQAMLEGICRDMITNLNCLCRFIDWHIVLEKDHIHLQTSGKNIKKNSKGVYKACG